MPTASEALLQIEFSESLTPMMELTDIGDQTTFASGIKYWSKVPLFEEVVLPNGIRSGGQVTPTAVNSQVSVAASEVNIGGVIHSQATGLLTVARPADVKVKISSVTLTSALALAMVAGLDGDAYSEVRGAAGGPPYIPVGSIEYAQVRLDSETAQVIVASEIKSIPGTHTELAGFPTYDLDAYLGSITFTGDLPKIHTGDLPKKTYAQFYTPEFVKIQDADAFTPPRTTYSLTSTTTYDGARGSTSSAINAGSFTALLQDGVSDPVMQIAQAGGARWIKFWSKKTVTGRFLVCQGQIGAADNYPSGANMTATFSISAERAVVPVGA